MYIPFDAESVKDVAELEQVQWLIKSAEYKKLADEMISLVLAFRDFDKSATFSDIYLLKVRNILFNIFFVSYSLLSVDRMQKKGQEFIASERSILLNALKYECFPEQSIFVPAKRPQSFKSLLKAVVDSLNLLRGTTFSYGPGPLSSQYVKEKSLSNQLLYWSPPQYGLQRTSNVKDTLHLREFASNLTVQFQQVLKNNDISVPKGAIDYINRSIKSELFMAFEDVNQSFDFGKKGNKLLLVGSGSHYPHRLLSYYFMRNGNKVIQFDHGGERALFLDSHWGVNEFSFLDVFMTFGKGLQKRIDKNVRDKKIPVAIDEKNGFEVNSIVLDSLRNIFLKNSKSRVKEVKKVMVLMPVLSGNWNIPGNYPPDLVFLKVIWQTIQELKRNQFYVILKKHSKSLRSKSICLFDQFVDEINEDYFSDVMDDADAYVFFYCGTAFCEAIMSSKPIVYIHLPYRQTDSQARLELASSLCWVDCDDTDGIWIDHVKMITYLKSNDYDIMPRRAFVEKNYLTS